jgi:hypothetical protein
MPADKIQRDADSIRGKIVTLPTVVGRAVLTFDGDTIGAMDPQGLITSGSSEPAFVVSGGVVAWQSGMVMNVSRTVISIDGTLTTIEADDVTLATADATHSRIDVIVANSGGEFVVKTGTPGENPVKPVANPDTEVELSQVIVPAGASAPAITQINLYLENEEWTAAANSGRLAVGSTNAAYSGTKSIEGTGVLNNDYVTLTADEDTDLGATTVLSFYMKLKAAWDPAHRLRFEFFLNGSRVSRVLELYAFMNFDSNNSTTWQHVAIAMSDFNIAGGVVDQLKITVRKLQSGACDLFLDNIVIQDGTPTALVQPSITTIVADNGSLTAYTPNQQISIVGAGTVTTDIIGHTLYITGEAGDYLTGDDIGTEEGDIPVLGTGGKLPTSVMPDAVLGAVVYQGTWDANANTPTLPSGDVANKGHYYRVATLGATNIDGNTDWKVGDWVISNGATWDKVDNTDPSLITDITGLQDALNGKSATSHSHSDATTGTPGFMPAADKTILDAATASATVSTLVKRDSNGDAALRNLAAEQGTFSKRVQPGSGTITIATGALTFTATEGNAFYVLADASFTLNAPAAGGSWQTVRIAIRQDAGGATLTLGTNLRLGADIDAVVLSAAAGKVDYLTLIWNPIDSIWDVVAFVAGYGS